MNGYSLFMDKQPQPNKKMKLWTALALIAVIAALIGVIVISLRKPASIQSSEVVSAPAPAATTPQPIPAAQRANPVITTNSRTGAQSVVNDIVFECSSCIASWKSVTCGFTVKNESSAEQDIMLIGFDNSTQMFDEFGNGYPASRIDFGNETSGRLKLVSLKISPNVIAKAAIQFDNVSFGSNAIALLRIKGGLGKLSLKKPNRDFRVFYVSFKNIAITR
jgi:hypothetical protein